MASNLKLVEEPALVAEILKVGEMSSKEDKKNDVLEVRKGRSTLEELVLLDKQKPSIGETTKPALFAKLDAFLPQLKEANQELEQAKAEEDIDEGQETITFGDIHEESQHVEIQVFVDNTLGEMVKDVEDVNTEPADPEKKKLKIEMIEKEPKE